MTASLKDLLSALKQQLTDEKRTVLCAPPGCGKSTTIPPSLLDTFSGTIIVLQPRRLAARSLASYVAKLSGESAPGESVGYRVKDDTCSSKSTRIIFETYGLFIRRALHDPLLTNDAVVILDEFHERTLDMDLALAWLVHLQKYRTDAPPFLVMSATLDAEKLCSYLSIKKPLIATPPVYPVTTTHVAPAPGEPPAQTAARAVRPLLSNHANGSILIFMPGKGEINATVDAVSTLDRNVPVYALHGSQTLAEQTRVIAAPSKEFCVIVSTNVAETSLTIPGIRIVIDSGLERRAAYDAPRDRNTLFRTRICKSSAIQRAGRAGREAPGQCIRLYSKTADDGLIPSLPAEITRLEVSAIYLQALGLIDKSELRSSGPKILDWMDPPDQERWAHSTSELTALGCCDQNGLTERGRELLAWPLDPKPALLVQERVRRGLGPIFCALVALLESQSGITDDLLDTAQHLVENPKDRMFSAETVQTYKDLLKIAESVQRSSPTKVSQNTLKTEALRTLITLMPHRIASRNDNRSCTFSDGSTAVLADTKTNAPLPDLLIALDILHTAGGGGRKTMITGFAAIEPQWMIREFESECQWETVSSWDEKRNAVSAEEHLLFRGIALIKRPVSARKNAGEASSALLVDKCVSGEINLVDESIDTLIARIALVAQSFPDYGIRVPDSEDFALIYEELCEGKHSAADLSPEKLSREILKYLGGHVSGLLDRLVPEKIALPSGKKGRVIYQTGQSPTLSARIGDLAGMTGRFTVCEGRVEGVFDILAPNYRTVQKTKDIGGFWTGVYPTLKNELKRRYPRHIWP